MSNSRHTTQPMHYSSHDTYDRYRIAESLPLVITIVALLSAIVSILAVGTASASLSSAYWSI